MDRFSPETLDVLRRKAEVKIETRMSTVGPSHLAIIWVVVDDLGRVLIRSYKGAQARWYREALARGTAAILAGDLRMDVRIEPAVDDERVAACSRALEKKYPDQRATEEMLRQEILDTTLELLPAGVR